ncbi:uncharacterized protein [Periplaneta americana]
MPLWKKSSKSSEDRKNKSLNVNLSQEKETAQQVTKESEVDEKLRIMEEVWGKIKKPKRRWKRQFGESSNMETTEDKCLETKQSEVEGKSEEVDQKAGGSKSDTKVDRENLDIVVLVKGVNPDGQEELLVTGKQVETVSNSATLRIGELCNERDIDIEENCREELNTTPQNFQTSKMTEPKNILATENINEENGKREIEETSGELLLDNMEATNLTVDSLKKALGFTLHVLNEDKKKLKLEQEELAKAKKRYQILQNALAEERRLRLLAESKAVELEKDRDFMQRTQRKLETLEKEMNLLHSEIDKMNIDYEILNNKFCEETVQRQQFEYLSKAYKDRCDAITIQTEYALKDYPLLFRKYEALRGRYLMHKISCKGESQCNEVSESEFSDDLDYLKEIGIQLPEHGNEAFPEVEVGLTPKVDERDLNVEVTETQLHEDRPDLFKISSDAVQVKYVQHDAVEDNSSQSFGKHRIKPNAVSSEAIDNTSTRDVSNIFVGNMSTFVPSGMHLPERCKSEPSLANMSPEMNERLLLETNYSEDDLMTYTEVIVTPKQLLRTVEEEFSTEMTEKIKIQETGAVPETFGYEENKLKDSEKPHRNCKAGSPEMQLQDQHSVSTISANSLELMLEHSSNGDRDLEHSCDESKDKNKIIQQRKWRNEYSDCLSINGEQITKIGSIENTQLAEHENEMKSLEVTAIAQTLADIKNKTKPPAKNSLKLPCQPSDRTSGNETCKGAIPKQYGKNKATVKRNERKVARKRKIESEGLSENREQQERFNKSVLMTLLDEVRNESMAKILSRQETTEAANRVSGNFNSQREFIKERKTSELEDKVRKPRKGKSEYSETQQKECTDILAGENASKKHRKSKKKKHKDKCSRSTKSDANFDSTIGSLIDEELELEAKVIDLFNYKYTVEDISTSRSNAVQLLISAPIARCETLDRMLAEHDLRFEVFWQFLIEELKLNILEAAGTKAPRLLKLLLKFGHSVDITDRDGNNPLHYAATVGLPSMAVALINEGVVINARNKFMETPLFVSMANGHVNFSLILVNSGANFEVKCGPPGTILHVAALTKNTVITKMLIECGARIDPRNDDHETPLMKAVQRGNIEIVQMLLKGGADVRAYDKVKSTPLHMAVENGSLELVKILVEYSAPLEFRRDDNLTPLILAVVKDRRDIVKCLAQAGAMVNVTHPDRETPLIISLCHENLPMMETLWTYGANLNIFKGIRWSPLFYAAKNRMNIYAVILLLMGSDVNDVDSEKRTPLHAAAMSEDNETVVRTLVSWGADQKAVDSFGQTPKELAFSLRNKRTYRVLCENMSNIVLSEEQKQKRRMEYGMVMDGGKELA